LGRIRETGEVQRRLLVLTAVVVVVAGTVVVAVGPAVLRPWRCHHAAERSTPRDAADAYYASCWLGPNEIEGPSDGGKQSTAFATWYALDEFVVVYGGGKTRFLLVGKQSSSSGWRALPPEGTGP
jgi:hypothetical protein